MRHQDAIKARRVPLAWRPPFGVGDPWTDRRPAGETLLDMVRSVPDLPRSFLKRGIVCINGEQVPREMWGHVRPKPGRDLLPVIVTMHLPLGFGGGGKSTAKSIVMLVAALALVVVTAGISGGWLATAGGWFAAGSTSAKILAGAVGLIGALGIAALSPPPSLPATASANANNTEQMQPASASGNVLQAGGAIPRVIGSHKIFPPLIGEPIVELVGDDEYVEAGYCLNGPHAIDEIRIGGVGIEDAEDVQFETREGWPGDAPLTLLTRYGKTDAPNIALSAHKVDGASQDKLAHKSDPTRDLPVWHRVASRDTPDEIWLHLLLPGGLSVNGSTEEIAVPFRVRLRKRGTSTWTNLPEIHLSDAALQQRRRALIFKFATMPAEAAAAVPPQKSGFVAAQRVVPAQTVAPATSGWTANSYFNDGAGNNWLNATNVGGSRIGNLALYDNRVEVYLDPATFTAGIYEIEIKRGCAYQRSLFADSTYQYSGVVKDFFAYVDAGNPTIPMSRANLADLVQLVRSISIRNAPPILQNGVLALVAVKARNRDVQSLSCIAAGYVKEWDGDAWTNWVTTSWPAAHYRDVLVGSQNLDPLPLDLLDEAGLLAWRAKCVANGWKCDAIIDDFRTQDVLALIASCGFAKPYQSEIYGVTVDDDRSADDPVQIFSRRNATNVRFERAFVRPVEGLIVNYIDKAADYAAAQVVVYRRDRANVTKGLFETATYAGKVVKADVTVRAQFDIDQADQRATFYYLDADIEAIVCRRGSLVGLQHDVLTQDAGDALIKEKILNADDEIAALVLDSKIPITNEPDMHATADMHAVADMHKVGVVTGVAIRHNDGTKSTHEISDPTGETEVIHLAEPIADSGAIVAQADDPAAPSLVVSGRLGSVYRRLLVANIAATKDLGATLTLVDEAPDLVRLAA